MSNSIAKIDADSSLITLINVYEVDREQQAKLAHALEEATNQSIRHQPGFVSVNIHSSLDGTRLVNYAQWASKADFEQFMGKAETQAQLKEFAALARSVSPALYKVDRVLAQ